MEKREIRTALQRFWSAALAAFVLALLLGVAVDLIPNTTYSATATVSVQPTPAAGTGGVTTATFLIPSYVQTVSTQPFYREVQAAVPPSVKNAPVKLSAKNQTATGIILVSATGPTATSVSDWATQAARLLVSRSNPSQNFLSFSLLQGATVPSSPSFPKPLPIAVGAVVLGLLAAPITAVVLLRMSTSAGEDDTQRRFAAPLLGQLPAARSMSRSDERLVDWLANGSDEHYGEALRRLRTNVELLAGGRIDSIAVTSASPGEGKSTVALALAWSLATVGTRTSLVDADLRNPSIGPSLGEDPKPGLSDLLSGEKLAVRPTRVPNLDFVGPGTPAGHPADVLTMALPPALDTLALRQETVVVDAPPLNVSAESALVLSSVRHVIMVVNRRSLRRSTPDRAMRALRASGVNVIGIVVNRASSQRQLVDADQYGSSALPHREGDQPLARPVPGSSGPDGADGNQALPSELRVTARRIVAGSTEPAGQPVVQATSSTDEEETAMLGSFRLPPARD